MCTHSVRLKRTFIPRTFPSLAVGQDVLVSAVDDGGHRPDRARVRVPAVLGRSTYRLPDRRIDTTEGAALVRHNRSSSRTASTALSVASGLEFQPPGLFGSYPEQRGRKGILDDVN